MMQFIKKSKNKISILAVLSCIYSCNKNNEAPKNTIISGQVFGTYYNIIYDSKIHYNEQFDSLFYAINKSMSTYQSDSDISKLNRNEITTVDSHFVKVFQTSKTIYAATNGAFDPTIGAVVNAWDFGPEGKITNLDSVKIASVMTSVGLDKVSIYDNNIIKLPNTFIDFNAIAKGYSLDVISEFLDTKAITNYLIDIGGEIRTKGVNIERKALWTAGIETPRFDAKQSILQVVNLNNQAMATSGTYRKFKTDANGNRYAHIIDTKTGYPSKTNILSVSVIASTCMVADAYATAFKVMGIDKVTSFLNTHPELKAFLIFEDAHKTLQTVSINHFFEND